MGRFLAPGMLCATLLAGAPVAARDASAPSIVGFEGAAMSLDEMNAYFRGIR